MIKFLYVVVIIITVFIGLTFTYMNNQTVALRYLFFNTEINLSLLLFYILTLGVFAGFFANFLSSLTIRRKLAKVKKELKSLKASSL